jgi:hypothetical protein
MGTYCNCLSNRPSSKRLGHGTGSRQGRQGRVDVLRGEFLGLSTYVTSMEFQQAIVDLIFLGCVTFVHSCHDLGKVVFVNLVQMSIQSVKTVLIVLLKLLYIR